MNKKVKFLILRFSSIGDIILTTPVIRCLKLQYPAAEVHYMTKEKFGFLLRDNPYIDRSILLKDNIKEILADAKKENYDYIIDLHNNIRTLRIKAALGKPSFSFEKLNFKKFLLTNFKINQMPDIHIVDRYMATLNNLNVVNDNQGLDYFIPEKDIIATSQLPVTHQDGFTAYAIGGQHQTKKLPVYRMIELCRKIGGPLILLGGPEDAEAGKEIEDAVGSSLIYNACGKYNFNQSASILNRARIVFTHDTGLMHVAAAFKKKTYAIWGNTVPAFGMYPYQTSYESIENNEISCRPCSKIGYKACPKKHFKCMTESSFDFVIG